MKKIGKYLIWFSPFLITVGLTVGFVSGDWDAIPLVLIILGLAVAVAWILWQSYSNQWWSRRSTQIGTNAIIATISAIAILGLINFLANRYNVRTDFTENQLFTLAPQSQEVVENLDKPAKVWIFDANKNQLDEELLSKYQRLSKRFNFEYVDPSTRLDLTKKFGVKDYGEVYLESGENRQLVQIVNPRETLSESRLTNRLAQISNPSTSTVYFLQGHGERQLERGQGNISQAVQALADQNYLTKPLNLAQSAKIPDDANAVVIAGPQRALSEGEILALRDYVNNGGNLLVMVDPNIDAKLDSFLREWGIALDQRLAINNSESAEGYPPGVSVVTQYGEHPITKDFKNGTSIYQLARPIETITVKEVEAKPLLLTPAYPASWAESDLESEELEFNENGDRQGPLTLGVALTRKIVSQPQAQPTPAPTPASSPTPTPTTSPKPTSSPTPTPTPTVSPTPTEKKANQNKSTESRMVVFGDSDFIADGLFTQQLNGDVFLNSVAWLSKQDSQPLSIRPKEAKTRRIKLSQAQANLVALSSVLVLPLIAFASAILLWFQRR